MASNMIFVWTSASVTRRSSTPMRATRSHTFSSRGRQWRTDKLRREAHKLMAATGVRKVRLYDARDACLSWMANNGVPDTVVSAWAGHSDLGFTKRT